MTPETSTNNPFLQDLSPKDIKTIESDVREQIKLEQSLVFDDDDYASISETEDDITGFHLKSMASVTAGTHLGGLMRKLVSKDNPSIVDLGGATDTLLSNLKDSFGSNINGTFTSLIKHKPNIVSKFKFVTTSAEMPPAGFYQAFDVVTSVNGPLTWSKRPDLVAKNIAQMVKPGGLLFVHVGYNIHTRTTLDFSIFNSFPKSLEFPLIVNLTANSQILFYLAVRSK